MKTTERIVTEWRERIARELPDPARALVLARWMIPLALLAGAVVEPLVRWLIVVLAGAGIAI
jgi:hypothetical protein